MYYLVDLKEQKTEVFKSKLDLLYYRFSKPEHRPLWWAPDEIIYRMMDFIELNVTGKDCLLYTSMCIRDSLWSRQPG